jgi:nucleoside-diphosphate-sugar epimerase
MILKGQVDSSTCATYGVPKKIPIPEEHPQNPINPYGSSKLMVGRMLADLGPRAWPAMDRAALFQRYRRRPRRRHRGGTRSGAAFSEIGTILADTPQINVRRAAHRSGKQMSPFLPERESHTDC